MKCGICKAEMEEKNVTYTEDLEPQPSPETAAPLGESSHLAQSVVVIRHVPAHVCTECGNTWYSGTIAAQLEKMVDSLASSAIAEVSVINYTKSVA